MSEIGELKRFFEDLYDSSDPNNEISEIDKCFEEVLNLLNSGTIRASENKDGDWIVNSWVKKAILMGFKYGKLKSTDYDGYDKIDLLKPDFRYRKVPGSLIRQGVCISDGVVVMPSYINIGAYIGARTMIDIYSCIGSCAQIGEECHISAGACIGGVLEPPCAIPVIIEDSCFVGANSSILEGVILRKGSVIASGVTISSSTKIVDRSNGDAFRGFVPECSVVVPGSYSDKSGLNINCAVIIKKVDKGTRSKSSINEILRDM
jgi:2,3,4,5-tetrahydropyridine-2-carboxylate N-succinyltransferase